MNTLYVLKLQLFDATLVGTILGSKTQGHTFSYHPSYLASPCAVALSASLPLQTGSFSEKEFRPFFEGLLAEGPARAQLAAQLSLPEDDYLALLEACGKECIGDVVITTNPDVSSNGSYQAITFNDVVSLFSETPHIFEQNAASRLSLAGTQNKTGLAHLPSKPMHEGWLKPEGYAATTHILKTSNIRDIPEIEFLCMNAAAACGIQTARVSLLDARKPVLAVERFDRETSIDGAFAVTRLHQEDMAQAFGILPTSKYAELEGNSIAAMAQFLKRNSIQPAKDIASLAKQLCFAYAIGDCDAHLKNYSVLIENSRNGMYCVRLSPAYDFVCTTIFPRFSREMAMSFGKERDIDSIKPETFLDLAKQLGIAPRALRTIMKPIADNIFTAISKAGSGAYGSVFDSTPYIADNLVDDIAPRVEIMQKFCS